MALLIEAGPGHGDGQLPHLALEAQIGLEMHGVLRRVKPIGDQIGDDLVTQLVRHLLDRLLVADQKGGEGADPLPADVGRRRSEGGQDGGELGDKDAPDAEGGRHIGSEQRPAAAIAAHRVGRRGQTAGVEQRPHRRGHAIQGDAPDTPSAFLGVEADRRA
jgi:hypothetical protein